MALHVKKHEGGGEQKNFTLPKKGQRPARLIGLVDVGVQPGGEFKGEKKPDVHCFVPFFWLAKDTYEDEEGKAHNIVKAPYAIKIYPGAEKSNYTAFCSGLDPEDEVLEEGVGDLSGLLNLPCLINIEHKESKKEAGRINANVTGYTSVPEGYEIDEFTGDTFVYDCDEPDEKVYEGLAKFYQELIDGRIVGGEVKGDADGDDRMY